MSNQLDVYPWEVPGHTCTSGQCRACDHTWECSQCEAETRKSERYMISGVLDEAGIASGSCLLDRVRALAKLVAGDANPNRLLNLGEVGALQQAILAVSGVTGVEVEVEVGRVHIIAERDCDVDEVALARAIFEYIPANIETTGMTLSFPYDHGPLYGVRWTWKRDLPTEGPCPCLKTGRDPIHGCEDCRNTGVIFD